jgi:hypothetical protein
VLRVSDLLVVAAPHRAYRDLAVDVPIIDIWGYTDRPARL